MVLHRRLLRSRPQDSGLRTFTKPAQATAGVHMTLHRDESSIVSRGGSGLLGVAELAGESESGAALALEAPFSLNPKAPGNEPNRAALLAPEPAAPPAPPLAAVRSLSLCCAFLASSFASLFEAVVGGLVVAIRWFGVVGAMPGTVPLRGGVEGVPPLSRGGDREREPVLLREEMARPELRLPPLPPWRPESEYVGVGGVRL
mmetsp:Transcript_40256/g.92423  ORF Transcript_40256/g.92423 Transcript_40256/m.92423 type:complete len:202 (-) Transcript_40256:782-1387(-)